MLPDTSSRCRDRSVCLAVCSLRRGSLRLLLVSLHNQYQHQCPL
jgi:hypothetical protein